MSFNRFYKYYDIIVKYINYIDFEGRNLMKILRFLFSRIVIVGLMIAIQFGVFLFFLIKFTHYSALVSMIGTLISALVVLWIINKSVILLIN